MAHSRTRRVVLWLVLLLLLGALAYNGIAFMHAWRMTHFIDSGQRTAKPERLSRWQKAVVLTTGVRIPKPGNRLTAAQAALPHDVVEILTDDGIPLNAWHLKPRQDPDGYIIFFHGYASSKSHLLEEAILFADFGWECLLVDFRGHGDSPGRVTTIGAVESLDVAAAYDWLARRVRPGKPLVLYGVSMGAAAILKAIAEERVAPAAIVLECPFDSLLHTVRHRFTAMGIPSFPSAELLVFWGGKQAGFDGFAFNPVDYARHVKCRTLLLHGKDDPRVTLADAERIRTALAGPTEFHVFDNSGHESYFALNPEEYQRLMIAWLLDVAGKK